VKNLDSEELLALLDNLENEQTLSEERAYVTFRLSKVYKDWALEVEHRKEEIQTLLTGLIEAEQVYKKRVQP